MRTLALVSLALGYLAASLQPVVAQQPDVAALVASIRQVDAEGQGHATAQQAWRQLAQASPDQLPTILQGFSEANELALNWLAAAVDQVAARALNESPPTLPNEALEAFVMDRSGHPRARRFAYEWLARADESAADRIIPEMLDDPSVEMRRDAVSRLLDQAREQADDAGSAKTTYLRALEAARDLDQVEDIAKALDKLGEPVDLARHFGFLMQWHLIAPFENTDGVGFAAVYPPEEEIDLSASYAGKGQEVRWSEHTTEDKYGVLDLNKVLDRHKGSVCYAYTEFESDRDQTVQFRLGTPTAWKLWVNDDLIFAREEYHRGTRMDQYEMTVNLVEGKNRILLKICQNEQTQDWAQRWQFQLRVCDPTGTAILSSDRDGE